jgi:hypothetical protein
MDLDLMLWNSLTDFSYTKRIIKSCFIYLNNLTLHYGDIDKLYNELFKLCLKKPINMYLYHEKFYIIGTPESEGFYIPLQLFTTREIKIFYNLVYEEKFKIKPNGFGHIEAENHRKIDIKKIGEKKVYIRRRLLLEILLNCLYFIIRENVKNYNLKEFVYQLIRFKMVKNCKIFDICLNIQILKPSI